MIHQVSGLWVLSRLSGRLLLQERDEFNTNLLREGIRKRDRTIEKRREKKIETGRQQS